MQGLQPNNGRGGGGKVVQENILERQKRKKVITMYCAAEMLTCAASRSGDRAWESASKYGWGRSSERKILGWEVSDM